MRERAKTPANSPIRVLLADRSDRLRHGWRDFLAADRRFVVVGGVGILSDLAAACEELAPDVFVLGLGDHDEGPYALSALGVLRSQAQDRTETKSIAVVADDAPAHLVAAIRAGANGVVLQDVDDRSFREAALAVNAGRAALDHRLTEALFAYVVMIDPRGGQIASSLSLDPAVQRALSPREREVLTSLAQGNRNDEIAAHLGVSVGTVKTHLRHIYRKLDVDDRVSAVLTAHQLHLLSAA